MAHERDVKTGAIKDTNSGRQIHIQNRPHDSDNRHEVENKLHKDGSMSHKPLLDDAIFNQKRK